MLRMFYNDFKCFLGVFTSVSDVVAGILSSRAYANEICYFHNFLQNEFESQIL
jgi:hypothetical protein